MRKVITYGTFDLFHYGHVHLLRRARELGDYLIVALSTDDFNEREKGKRTYFSYAQRKLILEAIRYVDEVIPEEFETSIEIFNRVLSKYLVPVGDINRFTHEVRAENYEMLRSTRPAGASLASLQKQMPDLAVTVYTVEKDSPLDAVSLLDAELRQKAGVTVVAVTRGEELFAHPGGDFRFAAGDLVYLFSSPAEAAAAAPLFAGAGTEE